VHDDLKKLLVEDLELDPEGLLPQATPTDAGLDSLALVELGMLLPTRCGVNIADDELAATATLDDLDRLVEAHRNPR